MTTNAPRIPTPPKSLLIQALYEQTREISRLLQTIERLVDVIGDLVESTGHVCCGDCGEEESPQTYLDGTSL